MAILQDKAARGSVEMIKDLKASEAWGIFRIISEFSEGVEKLDQMDFAITIFGSRAALL